MGLAEKRLQAQKNEKTTYYSPTEARAMPVPTSKIPEEEKFVVDSGAPMHMLSKKDLSSEELETLRRSRTPPEVQTNEEAQVCVYDIDLFVTVQKPEDTPAV